MIQPSGSKTCVLIIEDEPDIREVIRYNLDREGFRVLCSEDGEEGLEMLRQHSPDVVLLDLMLPGMDGIELCRTIKYDPETRATPVIMVTAKGEETDVVLGLGVGADDYIAKPFSPRELVARVKAVLRRGSLREGPGPGERIVRGGLIIDTGRHEVRLNGDNVDFTPTEFRLLSQLAAKPGRVFTRDQLLSRILGEEAVVTDRNVDVHVRAVRKKLGSDREMIETVRGVGYRFCEIEE